MRDFWIRITGRTLHSWGTRHVSSVDQLELQMPGTWEWTANSRHHILASKADVVAWSTGEKSFSLKQADGTTEFVQPRFFTWRFGVVEALPEFHSGKTRVASNGWMRTAADDTGEDNILNLPEPSHAD